MFVAINNKDMSAPRVLDWINRTKNANNNVISPEFAMEILGKTNFYGHIKAILKNIKENCKTKEDIEPYKEFILSCVDRREVSPQAMADLVAMAKLCGCEKEFDVVNDKVKIYEVKDCENVDVKIIKSKEELYDIEGEDLRVFFDADEVDLSDYNLKGLKIKFKEGAEVDLNRARNLPKDLDVSMCSVVDLSGCDLEGFSFKFREGAEVYLWRAENLPKDLDVSMCSKVNLSGCDLDGLKLKFREGADVNLSSAENLPKDLDVSMCFVVDLSGCDLEGLDLKFREGAEVYLSHAYNFQKDLDVSMCSVVDLSNYNLKGLKIKFREGAEVYLRRAYNFPKDLDVSMCSKINLSRCDLKGMKLKFREGAEVNLRRAINLPKDLDVSMCSKVNLNGCDLTGVEKIKFKDKVQEAEAMRHALRSSEKVEYAGDEKSISVVNGNSSIEM